MTRQKCILNITSHIGESHDLTVNVEAWHSKDPGFKPQPRKTFFREGMIQFDLHNDECWKRDDME